MEELAPVVLAAALGAFLPLLGPALGSRLVVAAALRLLHEPLETGLPLLLGTLLIAGAALLAPGRLIAASLAVTLLVGVVAAHLTAVVAGAVERLHHQFGILFGHFDVGELAEEVDVAHFLAA